VDRNILRLAIYEMVWSAEVPSKVAINEAIEIAKKFGTAESSRFINGVLDRIRKELRPAS
jgi:N utilization substance protein B